MSAPSQDQVLHISLLSCLEEGRPWSCVWVNGVDITPHVRSLRIEAGTGALADIWLELVGVSVGLQADVPQSRVQEMSVEEAEAHEDARLTIDQQRGQRQYGRKGVTPGVRVGISLGD